MTSITTDRPVELDATSLCTLEDLTDLPRVGFRGSQTADYLTARGLSLPEAPNRAVTQPDWQSCRSPVADRIPVAGQSARSRSAHCR